MVSSIGYFRIETTWAVDVDMIDAESPEGVGEEVLHGRRLRIDTVPTAVRPAQGPKLDREHRLVTSIAQRSADEQLIVPGTVVVAGVEQCHAGVERRVNRGDAFRFVSRAVHVGHAHAAKAKREDARAVQSKLARPKSSHGLKVDRTASVSKKDL